MTKLAEMLEDYLGARGDVETGSRMLDITEYIGSIEAKLFNAGSARQQLPDLRELAEGGAAAVIADRGQIMGLADTTVVVSAETLAKLVESVIVGEQARHAKREPAATMLAGLARTAPREADFAVPSPSGDFPGSGAGSIDIGAKKKRVFADS